MNKKLLFFTLFFLAAVFLYAARIDRETAAGVAKTFYEKSQSIHRISDVKLTLAYTDVSRELSLKYGSDDKESPVYFIFNINAGDGFVIVSADDRVTPVLGFATTGSYAGKDPVPPFRKLMEKYRQEILYAVTNELEADEETATLWKELGSGLKPSSSRDVKAVNPLMSTTWNQSPYENAMCPYDPNGPGGHCVTGCPATAMAQIMKYWNYPNSGTGFHSYNTNYGTLSADFGSTTYDWGAMPDHLNSVSNAVALIMFHAGVAVEMTYGPDGSYGWVIENDNQGNHPVCCQVAYKTYFGYSSNMFGSVRAPYSDTEWKQMLYTDLDAGRPVQYAGFGSAGGHTWVCDGYDGNYFHMNWGWGGQGDGFFLLDALNVGNASFNYNQQALFGIQPAGGSTTTSIQMYSSITVSPNPIPFGQGFSVNADVLNAGTANFVGDYTAALFNSEGTFIDYIATLTESNGLPPNYHYTNGLTFTTQGITAATPGNYIIGIFARPNGGGWTLVAKGSYANPVNVSVEGSANNIELYSSMTVDHNPITVSEPFNVTVDILNSGSTTFTGDISLDLHGPDGSWLLTIQEYNDVSLQAGYYFDDVVFSSPGLAVDPGNYYLVVWDKPTGGQWALVGSGSYSNPIEVLVTGQPLFADIYEANNSEPSATLLPVNFSGNFANVNTNGSNLHNGTDIDYYKIDLPAGAGYTLDARVHDSYNSGNGQTYTGDVMFSYKLGNDWSDTYDDVMSEQILAPYGGTLAFYVTPYYPGVNGTYLLDVNIARNAVGLDEQSLINRVQAYPNPADANVTFRIGIEKPQPVYVRLENLLGQKVIEVVHGTVKAGINHFPTDVSNLEPGYYIYQVKIGDATFSGKVIIAR